MEISTHKTIDRELCGRPRELAAGYSKVELTTTDRMAADDRGLVHGGFVFGLADYAAMLAVNDPHVVLGGAAVTFTRPVRVGETLTAEAAVESVEKKKHVVTVAVRRGEAEVFQGRFTCFVPARHVLD
ncbi:MAG: hotdog domain-containing protein [Desulfosudaceae bacterium]